jgi:hypothetical protein
MKIELTEVYNRFAYSFISPYSITNVQNWLGTTKSKRSEI